MPTFATAPPDQVIPKNRSRQPSLRSQTAKQYEDALRAAVLEQGQALVVEPDTNEKSLTIRNRIKRAAQTLGIDTDLTIRRRQNRIVAYLLSANGDAEMSASQEGEDAEF